MWSDGGRAYLYQLPTNCIVESKDFHNKSKVTADTGKSLMFCQFDLHVAQKNLECPPVFKYLIFSKDGKWMKYLLRGDGDGRLAVWKVPDTPECAMMQLKRSEGGGNGEVASHPIQSICSLDEIWASLLPKPPGVLNQVLITKIFQIFDRKSFSKIKYLSFSFSTLLQQDNKLVS